ncbi:MAG TPA: peptidylprolyl isomerase [Thiolinea sp.]|nr:peptidylprolyl isomerase [Thiolinea sp.]
MRTKIIPTVISSLLGVTLTLGSGLLLATEEQKPAESASSIVAIVNGVDIDRNTLEAVLEMAKRSGSNAPIDERALLDDLILTELARQEAKKSGLAERDDVKAKVANFEDKLILNTWMQEKAAALDISDEDLKQAYDARIADMPKTEYKARHILVKSEDEAKAIIEALKGGKDFTELAKEKSTGPSGPMGGDLGWFKPQSMVQPFAEAVIAMKPGDVSKEPVQTQFGWHVIKLEEQRDVKLPDLETMKPQLRRQLEQDKMREYMDKLQAESDVKILLTEKTEPAAEDEGKDTPEEGGDSAPKTE